MEQLHLRLEEPGWLPRWISRTPLKHPAFLLLLAFPPLADALHGLLSITHEPFRNAYDDFLHDVIPWAYLISPMLCYCWWRRILFLIVRRTRLNDRGSLVLCGLLIPLLALQVYAFSLETEESSWRYYASTIPVFAAGPAIAFLLGLIHMQRRQKRSLHGFLALGCSLSWLLIPAMTEAAYLTAGQGGRNNWFSVIPFAGSAGEGLIFPYLIPLQFLPNQGSMGFVVCCLLLAALLLAEWRIRRLSLLSTLTTLATIVVFLPFFLEWSNFILD